MFKINDLPEEIHIQGRSINIKKTSLEDLKNYLLELQNKEEKLIQEQNMNLSEILR